jgi:O-antigen ligase
MACWPVLIEKGLGGAPPTAVECAYYGVVLYAIMGPAIGLSMGMVGAGTLAVLAAVCITRLGSQAMTIFSAIAYPLGCAISFLVVQLIIYDESIMREPLREFISWMLSLVVVYSLSLRRGFLHRFALVAFAIGLTWLPYLQIQEHRAELDRVGLDRKVSNANPNDLAAWFGFCAVYFFVVGIEAKRILIRLAAWPLAIGCLYVASLTVSRGPLLGFTVAAILTFRRILKRSLLPVLCLTVLSWGCYQAGLFERAMVSYSARATEETGRFLVWPLALERFLDSPFIGVGISEIATYIPSSDYEVTPHNSFLFIALASGVVPLTFFVAYWWRAASGVLGCGSRRPDDTAFLIPLLAYAFLIANQLNAPFMSSWMMVILSTAIAAGRFRQDPRVLVWRIETGRSKGCPQQGSSRLI